MPFADQFIRAAIEQESLLSAELSSVMAWRSRKPVTESRPCSIKVKTTKS